MYKYRGIITTISGVLLTLGAGANAYFGGYIQLEESALPLGLLASFLLLYLTQPWVAERIEDHLPLYLILQGGIVTFLLLIPPLLDTFAVLFIAILLQVTPLLSTRSSFLLVAAFSIAASTTFILDEGFPDSLGQIFVYSASYVLVASFNITLIQLEKTRKQLEEYIAQAEELAAMKERNRLARELHDSVTQTIFGMTFAAETARSQLEKDPKQVPSQLDKLLNLAENALSEMRSLVLEMRPTQITEQGLVPALEKHIHLLDQQAGLSVELSIQGDDELDSLQAHRLFRITQESLNNVIKHAGTDHAWVRLRFFPDRAILSVSDQGRGFEPNAIDAGGVRLGLKGIRERVDSLKGRLQIISRPGEGTQILVEIPLNEGSQSE
jgi:signal transduction histidine kinase